MHISEFRIENQYEMMHSNWPYHAMERNQIVNVAKTSNGSKTSNGTNVMGKIEREEGKHYGCLMKNNNNIEWCREPRTEEKG